ncbi:MAG: hypothetical protein ALECFALPRED_010018 [Alectoria fallacina]|uniref:Cytochrome P450 n=1 Tax=Alectoria fallacina TaxID=1903189 RepID=A0A8H3J973_9LECA|nr:MAG: hypothetical protein ALECFALPRED_010018 [Alectoria fallacina]
MLLTDSFPAVSVTQVALAISALYALFACGRAIYNIYFHPLAKFPGPKLLAASFIPYYWTVWLGRLPYSAKELHDRYGPVVRLNPNCLTFNTAQSWKDVYGIRPGRIQLPKNRDALQEPEQFPSLIGVVNDGDHARVRGLLSPAFSDRAMREQEPLIKGYIDLLIQRLKEQIQGPNKGEVDVVRWFNFITFDVIGDLALGQPFGCVETGEYHFWVTNIFQGIKIIHLKLAIGTAYPVIGACLNAFFKLIPSAGEARRKHHEYTEDALKSRSETTEKKDFMSFILRGKEEKGLTDEEVHVNAALLIAAGSETSATLCSAAVYYLCMNKNAYDKVRDEVRTAFPNESDITFTSVPQLPYLSAVVDESLRIHPPAPVTLPRRTIPEGNVIDGHFVPGNVTVGVNSWATFRSKDNFRDPESFIPERWLDHEAYKDDQRAAFQPFSYGPRNCIGKTLAYSEIRSILARLLWNFDMELCEKSRKWTEPQTAFVLWEKPGLFVKLKERTF